MKKRILSFILSLAMVLPCLVGAVPVRAAETPDNINVVEKESVEETLDDPFVLPIVDEKGNPIKDEITIVGEGFFDKLSVKSKDGFVDFNDFFEYDPEDLWKLSIEEEGYEILNLSDNQAHSNTIVFKEKGVSKFGADDLSVVITELVVKVPEKETESIDLELPIFYNNAKVTDSLEFVLKEKKSGKEVVLTSKDKKLGLPLKDEMEYSLTLKENTKYTLGEFNFFAIQEPTADGNGKFSLVMAPDFTKEITKIELKSLEPNYKLDLVDEKGNKITDKIKFDLYSNFVNWDPVYGENGVLDLTEVYNIDSEDIIKLIPEGYEILNMSDNFRNKDCFVFKFGRVRKFNKNDLNEADDCIITKLVLKKVDTSPTVPEDEEPKTKHDKVVTLPDIKVSYFKDGTPVEDNFRFHTADVEIKDMVHYNPENGILKGVKVYAGHRVKIGIADNRETHTMTDGKNYFNYLWIKATEDGKPMLFDEFNQEVKDVELKELKIISRDDLKGTKPESGEKSKLTIPVKDLTTGEEVTKDSVYFTLHGGGEEQIVSSKDGKLELELYKDIDYTINIIRKVEYSYKLDGYKIVLKDDGLYRKLDDKKLESIDVYQGNYMIRIYVFEGNDYPSSVAVGPEGLKFKIVNDRTKESQIRAFDGEYLTFDAKLFESYTISLLDTDEYQMKDVHIEMMKYPGDGLYWPILDKEDTPRGNEDGKLKALYIQKPGKTYEDTEMPEDDGGGCGDGTCVFGDEVITIKKTPLFDYISEGKDTPLKTDVPLNFALFDSTNQEFLEDIKSVKGEDGVQYLPELKVVKGNRYILTLKDDIYHMEDVYIKQLEDGSFINDYKNGVFDGLVVYKKDGYKINYKHPIEIPAIYDGKAIPDVKFKLISEFETIEVTSDKNGQVKANLFEDVTYMVQVDSDKYSFDSFPLVIKDKQNADGGYWVDHHGKFPFDHSSCDYVQAFTLLDKYQDHTKDTTIACKSGKTKIKGLNFKNLKLLKTEFSVDGIKELADRDVQTLELKVVNPFRCEVSKLAAGEFKVSRNIETEKKVEKIYRVKEDNKLEELDFTQNKNFVYFTLDSLNVERVAIVFESDAPEKPETPVEQEFTFILMEDNNPVLESLSFEFKDLDSGDVNKVDSKDSMIMIKLPLDHKFEVSLKSDEKTMDPVQFVTGNDGPKVVGEDEILATLSIKSKKVDDEDPTEDPIEKISLDKLTVRVLKNGKALKGYNMTLNKFDGKIPSVASRPNTDDNGEIELKDFAPNSKYEIRTSRNDEVLKFKKDVYIFTTDEKGNVVTIDNKAVESVDEALLLFEGTELDNDVFEKFDVDFSVVDSEGKPVSGVEFSIMMLAPRFTTVEKVKSDKDGKVVFNVEGQEGGKDYSVTLSKMTQFEYESDPHSIEFKLDEKGNVKVLDKYDKYDRTFVVTKNDKTDIYKEFKKLYEEAKEYLKEAKFEDSKGAKKAIEKLQGIIDASKKEIEETLPIYAEGKIKQLKEAMAELKKFEIVDDKKPEEPKPTPKPTPSVPTEEPSVNKISTDRTNGKDRIATAIEISKKYYGKADNVVVVDAKNFPDAMTASVLAKLLNAPILLTYADNLDSRVADEIQRLGARNVTIVGGGSSISENVKDKLTQFDKDGVERLYGKNRYETSAQVARKVVELAGNKGKAIIASGEVSVDALTIGPMAAKEGLPILLVSGKAVPAAIGNVIDELGIKDVIVAGGSSVVAESLEAKLPTVSHRLKGQTRYETAIAIAEYSFAGAKEVFLANGENWMDALVIGPVGGTMNMPILLTRATEVPKSLKEYVEKSSIEKVTAIGGKSMISEKVLKEISK
ncbi:cell wall-binding repeat-containing protein [Lagierella sp.]|uniref:cell wall-binding repeat-containing protein n=1 Tax=Lagierella sp. TaxID=2849657 RepID=UPI00261199AC|nr:cell wall-binding repeat-containing protein [Lagierella sp.]